MILDEKRERKINHSLYHIFHVSLIKGVGKEGLTVGESRYTNKMNGFLCSCQIRITLILKRKKNKNGKQCKLCFWLCMPNLTCQKYFQQMLLEILAIFTCCSVDKWHQRQQYKFVLSTIQNFIHIEFFHSIELINFPLQYSPFFLIYITPIYYTKYKKQT